MPRTAARVLALCSLLALATSVELTYVHFKVHTDPGHRSVCAVGEGMDCDVVAASPAAAIFGVPNALWCLLCHLVLLWLVRRATRPDPESFPRAPGALLLWLVVGMGGYTAWLVYYSIAAITSFCLFCAVLWVLHAVQLATVFVIARQLRPFAGLRDELTAAVAAPARPALAAALLAATAAGLMIFVPPLYSSTPALADEVTLERAALPADIALLGPDGAPHLLVAVSDYRCPYCRIADDAIRRVHDAHPESLQVAHLHYPIDGDCNPAVEGSPHPGACLAAYAAICAGRQGRYWDMHAALFALDGDCDQPAVDALAADLGLDGDAFQRCLDSAAPAAEVETHVELAEHLGIDGTPTLYFDGRAHPGPMTLPELLGLLGAE